MPSAASTDAPPTRGQAGVELALDLIGKELSTTMGLTGINRIDEIDRHVLTDHMQTNA